MRLIILVNYNFALQVNFLDVVVLNYVDSDHKL